MTPELQRYYEDTLAMFNSQGWKNVVEDLTKLRTDYNDVRNCTNLERTKGQVDILDHVLGLPGLFERAFDQLKAEE